MLCPLKGFTSRQTAHHWHVTSLVFSISVIRLLGGALRMNYQLLRSSICAILSLSNQNLPALDSEYLALIVIGNSA
jgi:hypothetical protein